MIDDDDGQRDSPAPPTLPPNRVSSQAPTYVSIRESSPDIPLNAPPEIRESIQLQNDLMRELQHLTEKLGRVAEENSATGHRGVNKVAAAAIVLATSAKKMVNSVEELTATSQLTHTEVQGMRADLAATQEKILSSMATLLRQFSHVLDKTSKALRDCVDEKLQEHVEEHHSEPDDERQGS